MSPSVTVFHQRTPTNVAAFEQLSSGEADIDRLPALRPLAELGWKVHCNLAKEPGPILHQIGDRFATLLNQRGALGGDVSSALANLTQANGSDVIWSTVDTLGIPLARMKKLGLLRKPLLYSSIGLPERLQRMQDARQRQRLLKRLEVCDRILCYGWAEAEQLREWLPAQAHRIHFIPYTVDPEIWKPLDLEKEVDVVSVGFDVQRDYALLRDVARQLPDLRFRIYSHPGLAQELGEIPANLECCGPVPLEQVARVYASAKVVALPVKENSYSGGTTTLLQALSMSCAVVVSESGAIREGYGLQDQELCSLAAPGDVQGFAQALRELLADERLGKERGRRARVWVQQHLCRQLWVDQIDQHLRSCILS